MKITAVLDGICCLCICLELSDKASIYPSLQCDIFFDLKCKGGDSPGLEVDKCSNKQYYILEKKV